MIVKLLTEQHLEFLSLKGGCTGSFEYSCQNAILLEITCCGSNARDSNITALDLISVNPFLSGSIDAFRGRSRISGKWVHMYKGVGAGFAVFISFFLNIPCE